jgi:hypothetical protein
MEVVGEEAGAGGSGSEIGSEAVRTSFIVLRTPCVPFIPGTLFSVSQALRLVVAAAVVEKEEAPHQKPSLVIESEVHQQL